jgi:cytoskeletal protein RodZ
MYNSGIPEPGSGIYRIESKLEEAYAWSSRYACGMMISQTEMKSLGESFKQRRKEMNLSLKEAENATSIRATYLQSIEEGEVNKLISPVYARGFVKQYAAFLGLDGDKIIRDHPHIFNRAEAQEFSYGIGTLEVRGNPGAGVKWFPNAVWVIASVVIIFLAWYLAHFLELI